MLLRVSIVCEQCASRQVEQTLRDGKERWMTALNKLAINSRILYKPTSNLMDSFVGLARIEGNLIRSNTNKRTWQF
jgi:hypothetical protein